MSDSPDFLYEKRGHIAIMTWNRPEKKNCFTPQMMDDFYAAFDDFDKDDELWVAILAGAGEDSWCAGGDLDSMIPVITSGEWKVDDQGHPVAYKLEGQAGDTAYSIDCEFLEDKVVERVVQAGQPTERTIPLTEKIYLIDNNNMSLFAFLMAALPREKGRVTVFKVFHPSTMQLLPAQVTVRDRERITVNGQECKCWALDVSLAGTPLTMWVDDQGRLLKDVEAGGRMVVELMREDQK